MLGRILRSADFERALGHPACARSPHFAIHFADARPSRVSGSFARAEALEEAISQELSTVDELVCTQPVDDSLVSASPGGAGSAPQLWLGAIVPKRHARRAVTRTLIKRQIRAALLRREPPFEPGLPSGLLVVRLRAPFDRAAYPSAASDALRRAASGELDALLAQARRKLATAQRAPGGAC